MYNDDDLNSAVQVGIFSRDAVAAFRQQVGQQRSSSTVDEEQFRLIGGFNDFFVVIACLLMLVSVSWIGSEVESWLGAMLAAATAWGLAEYFIRVRRMALPSIVLLLTFVGGVSMTALLFLASLTWSEGNDSPVVALMACLAGAGAAWLHWRRFQVPITVAAGAVTLVGAALFSLLALFPELKNIMLLLVFVAGLLLFALAMRWDASDTLRQTRRSDVAFWLHLAAAPLLVHPIFALLGVLDQEGGVLQALSVGLLYLLIALVSISIDRRALMVSALVYVLYAITLLLREYGVVSLSFAFAALTIGGGLLVLSAFWHRCREWVLPFYPKKMRAYFPALK
ncbi:MAG: hypothetical protein Q9N68_05910 [Gammaproteobacteria bacterium]|nr:hypothetical protein [Gammaproteobacteria bacterium]